jgi:single-stranded-DNA-specific exonuclease
MEIALHLETLNQERKTLESITFEEAVAQIESEDDFINKPMVMVSGENWHQGVLGIIASRLKERYGKPTIVISTHNGMCKGSSRSITGIDIGSMLSRAKTSGILTQGGGHAMAGGFSLEQHKLSELEGFFMDALSDSAAVMESYKDMQADAAIALSAVTRELVEILTRAAPFGSGNPQPKFLVSGVTVIEVRVVGDNHLMIIVADKRNMPNRTMKCMMFKALDTEYGPKLLKSAGKEVHILGSVQSHYQDPKRADIIVDDIIFV